MSETSGRAFSFSTNVVKKSVRSMQTGATTRVSISPPVCIKRSCFFFLKKKKKKQLKKHCDSFSNFSYCVVTFGMDVEAKRSKCAQLTLDSLCNGLWLALCAPEKKIVGELICRVYFEKENALSFLYLGNGNFFDPLLNDFVQLAQNVTSKEKRARRRKVGGRGKKKMGGKNIWGVVVVSTSSSKKKEEEKEEEEDGEKDVK